MLNPRRLLFFVTAIFLLSPVARSRAQAYTSIVVFGDSLSDTGNVTALTSKAFGIPFPSPYAVPLLGPTSDFTLGRFTDGPDSTPASAKFKGVWVEQLAAMLPEKPVILNSLSGGANYAYGGALAANGSTVASLGPYSITVDNVGLQITNYLATHPKIDDKTLFIVWAGTNDLLAVTSPAQVPEAAIEESIDVQRLLEAGATQIVVPNLPALGKTPQVAAGGPTSVAAANQATIAFNDTLSTSLDILELFYFSKHPSIYRLDVYTLFNKIIANPASFGITNVTAPAQETAVNPDTYLFWDGLHPTTKAHNLLALDTALLMEPAICRLDPTISFCPKLP